MERAGRTIAKLKTAHQHLTVEELIVAAWPAAVGKRLAGRTRVVAVREGRMVVEVEDEVWRRNLAALSPHILKNMAEMLETSAPSWIEFRVGIPRRPPQREQVAARVADESDGIADPGLRRIYINSRRKAQAS
ncbi:MAG: DUF721 domain-containing protein [Candidatus Solibacter usitatus]|nr:DUF721 domain-containing protein [Candidatus Solibacter usitatus]